MEGPGVPLPYGTVGGSSRSSLKTHHVTTDAAGIRDFAPWRRPEPHPLALHRPAGDSYKSRMFDLEPSGNLWVILDMDAAVHVGEGDESTEEYAVKLAGAITYQAIRENKAVGLIASSDRPARGGAEQGRTASYGASWRSWRPLLPTAGRVARLDFAAGESGAGARTERRDYYAECRPGVATRTGVVASARVHPGRDFAGPRVVRRHRTGAACCRPTHVRRDCRQRGDAGAAVSAPCPSARDNMPSIGARRRRTRGRVVSEAPP